LFVVVVFYIDFVYAFSSAYTHTCIYYCISKVNYCIGFRRSSLTINGIVFAFEFANDLKLLIITKTTFIRIKWRSFVELCISVYI